MEAILEKVTALRNNGQADAAIAKYHELIKENFRVGYCWQMIGVCYNLKNDSKNAAVAIRKAIKIFVAEKDNFNLGCAYRDLGLATESVRYLRKSEQLLIPTKKFAALGITQAKIGTLYLKSNKRPLAKKWLIKGLRTIRQEGDWFMEMTALLDLARLDLALGNFSAAVDKLWACLGLIYDQGALGTQKRRLAEIYVGLYQGYLGLGNKAFAQNFKLRAEKLLVKMPPDIAKPIRSSLQI